MKVDGYITLALSMHYVTHVDIILLSELKGFSQDIYTLIQSGQKLSLACIKPVEAKTCTTSSYAVSDS